VSYLGSLIVSVIFLPLVVTHLQVTPLIGGALVMILSVTLSYILHKRFSFRRG
jgi:putative flippase GtrA